MEETMDSNKKHNFCIIPGRVKLSDIYIVFIGIYFFMYSIIHGTNFYQMTNISSIISSIWGFLWIGIRLLILIKVISEYQRRDWKVILLLIFSMVLSVKADGVWFTDAVWIICSLKHVDYKALLKCVFFALMMSLTCIVGLCYIGKLSDDLFFRGEGLIRHSFGYQHPNTLAIRVFELCAIFVCIMQKKLRYVHSVIFMVLTLIVKYYTDCTTAGMMLGILSLSIIFICYANNSKNRRVGLIRKFVRFCMDKMKYMVYILPVLTIVFVLKSSWLQSMAKGTLLSRIIQARLYYSKYGISLLGSRLQVNNQNKNWSLISDLYTLDNGYMYMLLGYGIIAFALFIYVEVRLFVLFARKKNYTILTVLALYAVYGFMETMLIRIDTNFTLLFIGICLWENNRKKIDDI